jgi:RHS repeat-associated protein
MYGHQTRYTYDAAGNKHRVVHTTVNSNLNVPLGGTVASITNTQKQDELTTDYCGNIIYENNQLKYILHPEGYTTLTGTTPTYHYYLRDHLGNNRTTLAVSGNYMNVIQRTDYYPFGMEYLDDYDPEVQPYKFGGKELDDMHGLNTYDQGFRQFSATLPITSTMDPLAEKYYSVSPYSQWGNNPVNYIDPTGMEWLNANDSIFAASLSQAMTKKVAADQKSLDKLNAKIAKNEAKGKNVSKDQAKAAEKQANINNLNAGISELSEMGATPDQLFTYNMTEGSGYTYVDDNGVIVMDISGNGSIPNGVHESSHGFDVWKSGMPQNTVKGIYPGEIKAYSRQFSLGGASAMPISDYGKIGTISDISYPWIAGIKDSYGAYLYPKQILGAKYPYLEKMIKASLKNH